MSIFRKPTDSPITPPSDREIVTAEGWRAHFADLNWWKIGGLTVGGLLGVGTLTFWGASIWIAENLSPTIAKELSKSLGRDVRLGKLENIGLNEISFGASSIAATADSTSKVSIKGINIRFDPWSLLVQRTLKPDITIQEPDLYLAEDAQGNWLKIPDQPPTTPGLFKTEVQAVHIRKAQGAIVPHGGQQHLSFRDLNFDTTFQNRSGQIQGVEFSGTSQVDRSSNIAITGSSNLIQQTTHAEIRGQTLNAAQVSSWLRIPAVKFQSGTVDGHLTIDLLPKQSPQVQGTIQVHQATIQIDQVPQLFRQSSGTVQISSQAVQLQDVDTLYGQVPGRIVGTIDFTKGYDLRAQIAPQPIAQVLKTIQVESPITLAGNTAATLALTGRLDRPLLTGKVQTMGTAQVDRLQFNQVQGNFSIIDGQCRFDSVRAWPAIGGAVTGQGSISLTAQPQINLNFQGERLPADLLAKIYGQRPPIGLGIAQVSGQVAGVADRLTTDLQIAAPHAVYPGSANLQISPQGAIQIRQAKVRLAGQEISGTGSVDKDRWQVKIQVPQIETQKLLALQKNSSPLPPFLQGTVSGQLSLNGATSGDTDAIESQGQLQLKTAAGIIQTTRLSLRQGKWQSQLHTQGLQLAKIDSQLAGQIQGQFQVAGLIDRVTPETITATGQGSLLLGAGRINGQNLRLTGGKWQGDFNADRFDLRQISGSPVKGQVSGRARVQGDLQKISPTTIQAQGSGILQLPIGRIAAQNVILDRGQWQGTFSPEQLEISQFAPQVRGKLTGQAQLAGNLQNLSFTSLRGNGSGRLQLPAGQVVAQQVQLQNGNWQANFALTALQLGSVASDLPRPWRSAVASGQGQASGRIDRLTPQSITLQGDGQLQLGQGRITAKGLTIKDGQWQGLFGFQSLALQPLDLDLPPSLRAAQVDGQFQLVGSLQSPSLHSAQGNGRLRLPGGQIVAQRLELAGDRWQGQFQSSAFPLSQLPIPLPPELSAGKITSAFILGGSRNDWTLQQLTGSGSTQIDLASSQIKADRWQLANGRWQGQLTVSDLDLPWLSRFFPTNPITPQLLSGKLTASGQVAGNINRLNLADWSIDGQIALAGLRLSKLPVEANWRGQIQNSPGQGLNLQLAGQRDRLELQLGQNNQLWQFLVQMDNAIAQGQMAGDNLQVKAKNLPVELFSSFLPPLPQLQNYQLKGVAAGELSLNLKSGVITGQNLVIDKPQIGTVIGDRLQSSDFQYANGLLEFKNGEFLRGDNQYLIAARFLTTSQQPEYQLTVRVPKGQLADVSSLFQIFSIEDLFNPFADRRYGRASDLQPKQAGSELRSLQEQVERLSEIKRLQTIQAELQPENPIPDLRKLQGDFTGIIVISNAAKSGAYASFNVQGKNWDIDQYHLSQIDVQGKWQNDVLSLGALELLATDAKFKVAGEFGFSQQNARIEVEKFPAERLSNAFKLPIEIAGDVNLQAQLSGTWFNPQLMGTVSLNNGKLNQADIPVILANFAYTNARLKLDGNGTPINQPIAPGAVPPIIIGGSIPYKLPFALVPPDNDKVFLNLNLYNQGLKILDVLSQQQAIWVGGIGQVDLTAEGQLKNNKLTWNTAKGKASTQNAEIKFSALSDSVTALNSRVLFDFDRIEVEELAGKYNNGLLLAVGTIPINTPVVFPQPATCLGKPSGILPAQQPLAVSFERLQIRLKDKYEGDLSGCVVLGKIRPNGQIDRTQTSLGGEIKLANGKAILPSQSVNSESAGAAGRTSEANAIVLDGLKVVLGENITLEQFGLLSLVASGELVLKGNTDLPEPTGNVNLTGGFFTLFTNKFKLIGNDNVAKFTGNTDAVVSLNLATKVLETSRLPVTVGNERREQNDIFSTSLGQVQSIQIEAAIKDLPISRLKLDDAEFLRSKPPRNKDEILLLLTNGLGRVAAGEESVGTGLINWAGSAVLGGIQSQISDLLGLTDFRLYPSISQGRGSTTSALGLAGEVGFNINDSVSVSFFKILTSADLPQYSVRYQIDDRLLLRGSYNFNGDARAILEFEQRF